MTKKIKLGILGGGGNSLIGELHRVAAFINENYEIVGGVFSSNWEENIGFSEEIGLSPERIYLDLDSMVAEELNLPETDRIKVVSILTPNFLHFSAAIKLIDSGFHVICEKPMTTTFKEAKILEAALTKSKTVFALTHT